MSDVQSVEFLLQQVATITLSEIFDGTRLMQCN